MILAQDRPPSLELTHVVRRSADTFNLYEAHEPVRIFLPHVEAIQEVGDKQRALFLMVSGREILVDEPYVVVCGLIDGTMPDPDADLPAGDGHEPGRVTGYP